MEEYTQQQRRQRSLLFIGAGLVFIVLIFLLIWFMKQRNEAYTPQNSPQTAVTQPSTQDKPAQTTPESPPSQPSPVTPSTPETQSPSVPQNPTPSTPAPQETAELPATGMSANVFMILGASALSYVVLRYSQSRRALQGR